MPPDPAPPNPPPSPDQAHTLLSKAAEDAALAAKLAPDAEVSDEHIGFFCQQAAEKAIKAVLARRGIRYRRTHELAELLDVLIDHAIPFPPQVESAKELTLFAAALRYDYLPPDAAGEGAFDRAEAVRIAAVVVAWAVEACR